MSGTEPSPTSKTANDPKLWAGRFSQETDALVHEFNASLRFDRRLWRHDITGSIAHVKMLGARGIIPPADSQTIVNGLESLAIDLDAGTVDLPAGAEDVHMAVESLLKERIGAVAGRLHTARSRNDQVATDIRLWTKQALLEIRAKALTLQGRLVNLAAGHMDVLLPGMTHLQHAQPIRLSHQLLAYFWMLTRDVERINDAFKRTDVLPLGAGALAGTTFPIDRHMVAQELGFAAVAENSLDAVSDRDFAIETIAALSIMMMHLSRLCEELILWNSKEFGYVEMGDNVTTGSSIMPQKKNPDVAELVRGKTGRVYGSLMSLLTTMKALPLTYNKDMQEDKEPLFDAVDTALVSLATLNTLMNNVTFKSDRMLKSLEGDFSTATDLADYLVRQGLPFRDAHEVVGKLVANCIAKGHGLEELTSGDLESASNLFAGAVAADLVAPQGSADGRISYGGTGKSAVESQLANARDWLSKSS